MTQYPHRSAPHIQTHSDVNTNKTQPLQVSGLSRLGSNCFYTRPISIEELKRYFKRTKNKIPTTTSKINKAVLEKCTNKSTDMLTNIFNACFSGGLFLTAFKKAIIKFILKEGKSPKDSINY